MTTEKKAIVIVDRAALLRAVQASNAVEARNTIPILSNMLIEAEGEKIALTGTDLDMSIRIAVAARCEGQPLATTVAAKRLATLVQSSDDGCQIKLTHESGGRDVEMRAGRSLYRLPQIPRDDFPLLPFEHGPAEFTISASAFAAVLARTAEAESDNPARYYLNGTALTVDGDRLVAVATNGFSLASVDLAPAPEGWPTVVVPSKLTALLARLLKDGEGDIRVALNAAASRIRVEWGEDWTITSKLIDGKFPENWAKVLPAPCKDRRVVADSGAVQRAIRRVCEMSQEKTKIIDVVVGEDMLTIRCQSADIGFGEEQVPASATLKDMSARFNSVHLRGAVAAASGDSVALDFGEHGKATVRIAPQAGGGFAGCVHPIQN
jgi:DNA polymerase-3 subunit beta